MNQDQVLSLVRAAFLLVGPELVRRGYVDENGWNVVAGAVVTIIPIVWSWFVHKGDKPAS